MPIRLSGMSSGLDTEALVSALVSSYNYQKDNLVKAQKKLSWKQDAWKSMNTKIYSFYKGKLSSAQYSKAYNLKKATISNSTYATVTASSNAVAGNQTLKVNKLASSGYLTGGKIAKAAGTDGKDITTSTKMSEILGTTTGKISVKAGTADAAEIEVTSDMTVGQFVSKLNSAGVNASFDETNQRFFVSAKISGASNDFTLSASNAAGQSVLTTLGINANTATNVANEISSYTAIASSSSYVNDTAKSLYDAAVSGYNTNITSLLSANKTLSDTNKTLQYQMDYAKNFCDAAVNDSGMAAARAALNEREQALAAKETAGTITDDEKLEYAAVKEVGKTLGNAVLTYDDVAAYRDDITTKNTASKTANTATITSNETTIAGYYTSIGVEASAYTINSATGKVNVTDASAGIDDETGKVTRTYTDAAGSTLASDSLAQANAQKDYAQNMVDAYTAYESGTATTDQLTMLGLSSTSGGTGAVRIAGADSEIELNGALYTNNTNNFSINGLTIAATALTGDQSVTITTGADVDGIYDYIKGLLKDYNELIKAMDTAYNADSASGYEPLTSEEKDAMSDTEVEEWEKKIKDALLRKDSTLSTASSMLKTDMLSVFEIDGKKYSLASFGIATDNYFLSGDNEKGVLHINGDADDDVTAANADKLKAMIASDPETVSSFFSQLATKVYSDLGKKMQSTQLSSAYTIYNDKELATEYSDYTTKISDKETQISTWEDYYYKMFSKMESALASLNSKSSSLSGLLGQ